MLPHLPLCSPASEVSLLKIIHTGGVNGPVVTLAIGSSPRLQEEIIERQVVSDAVPPALAAVSEVREVVQHVLVDVSQHQLLLRAAEDGHGDESNVGVLRLGFVREGDPEESGVKLGHGEHCQVSWGRESLVDQWQCWRRRLEEWWQ